jgi:hypothetical protein
VPVDPFLGGRALLDTRDVELVAIHSIPAARTEYALLVEAECNTPVAPGNTRNPVAAGTDSFEWAARKRIPQVEADTSIFAPEVGIRTFVVVDSKRLFDPSAEDSTLTQQSPRSTTPHCLESKLNVSIVLALLHMQ